MPEIIGAGIVILAAPVGGVGVLAWRLETSVARALGVWLVMLGIGLAVILLPATAAAIAFG